MKYDILKVKKRDRSAQNAIIIPNPPPPKKKDNVRLW